MSGRFDCERVRLIVVCLYLGAGCVNSVSTVALVTLLAQRVKLIVTWRWSLYRWYNVSTTPFYGDSNGSSFREAVCRRQTGILFSSSSKWVAELVFSMSHRCFHRFLRSYTWLWQPLDCCQKETNRKFLATPSLNRRLLLFSYVSW